MFRRTSLLGILVLLSLLARAFSTSCPAGQYAAESTSECLICPRGNYCPGDSAPFQSCPAGRYGNTEGLPTIICSGLCPAGHYCPLGTADPIPCLSWSEYCPERSTAPEPVPSGFYSTPDHADIAPCPEGSYCVQGIATTCEAGSFALAQRSTCSDCLAGYYSSASSSTSCSRCLAGTYNPGARQSHCYDCPTGYFCQQGASSFINTPCLAGRYGATEKMTSSSCSGSCNAGYYCPAGSTSAFAVECGSSAFYCPAGSGAPLAVPSGFYSDAGSFSTKSSAVACSPGSYCVDGVSKACPSGTFSNVSEATACDTCNAGSFSAGSATACSTCSVGRYSSAEQSSTCSSCPRGYYCPEGSTSFVDLPCPAGRYGANEEVTSDQCSGACDEGYWCPASSTSAQANKCGAESVYCPAGSSTPIRVPVGYSSYGGTFETQTAITVCTPGYFCVGGISRTCPAGSFSNTTGASSCVICAAGFNSSTGSTACVSCVAGTYASLSGQAFCADCPAGSYCPSGSSEPAKCPAGRYGSVNGLSSSLCSGSCAAGHWCPVGSTSATAFSCGSNSVYCPQGSPGVVAVPSGYYSSGGSMTTRTEVMPCQPGSYCVGGVSYECPVGAISNTSMATACWSCPVGYFSGVLGGESCSSCPVGRFTATPGSSQCSSCAGGFYQADIGQSFCHQCLAGSYAGSLGSVRCELCNIGDYQPKNGSLFCLQCPAGRYNNHRGSSAECFACTADMDCAKPGVVATQDLGQRWKYFDDDGILQSASCPAHLCDGSMSPQETRCSSRRVQSSDNVLCGTCSPGYAEINQKCVDCAKSNTSTAVLIVVISLMLLLTIHMGTYLFPGLLAAGFFFLQTAYFLTEHNSLTEWLSIFSLQLPVAPTLMLCMDSLGAYTPVFLQLVLPVTMLVLLGLQFVVHMVYHQFCRRQVSRFPVPSQASLVAKLAAKTFAYSPLLYSQTLGMLLLLSFSSLFMLAIRFLQCREVGPHSVNAFWPSIDCSASAHSGWTGIIILVLLAMLGGLFYVLWKMRRYHQRNEPSELCSVSALCKPMRPDYYAWHGVILLRRIALMVVLSISTLSPKARLLLAAFIQLASMGHHATLKPYVSSALNKLDSLLLSLLLCISVFSLSEPMADSAAHRSLILVLVIVGSLAMTVFSAVKRGGKKRASRIHQAPATPKEQGLEMVTVYQPVAVSSPVNSPVRPPRPDRPRPERLDRPDRPDRSLRSDGAEHSQGSFDRGDRSNRSDRSEYSQRSDRSDRLDHSQRSDRSDRFERSDRLSGASRPSYSSRHESKSAEVDARDLVSEIRREGHDGRDGFDYPPPEYDEGHTMYDSDGSYSPQYSPAGSVNNSPNGKVFGGYDYGNGGYLQCAQDSPSNTRRNSTYSQDSPSNNASRNSPFSQQESPNSRTRLRTSFTPPLSPRCRTPTPYAGPSRVAKNLFGAKPSPSDSVSPGRTQDVEVAWAEVSKLSPRSSSQTDPSVAFPWSSSPRNQTAGSLPVGPSYSNSTIAWAEVAKPRMVPSTSFGGDQQVDFPWTSPRSISQLPIGAIETNEISAADPFPSVRKLQLRPSHDQKTNELKTSSSSSSSRSSASAAHYEDGDASGEEEEGCTLEDYEPNEHEHEPEATDEGYETPDEGESEHQSYAKLHSNSSTPVKPGKHYPRNQ